MSYKSRKTSVITLLLWFSGVFRVYKMGTLARNGLKIYISLARKFLYKNDMNKSTVSAGHTLVFL